MMASGWPENAAIRRDRLNRKIEHAKAREASCQMALIIFGYCHSRNSLNRMTREPGAGAQAGKPFPWIWPHS
jgi:hypothetical protein